MLALKTYGNHRKKIDSEKEGSNKKLTFSKLLVITEIAPTRFWDDYYWSSFCSKYISYNPHPCPCLCKFYIFTTFIEMLSAKLQELLKLDVTIRIEHFISLNSKYPKAWVSIQIKIQSLFNSTHCSVECPGFHFVQTFKFTIKWFYRILN